MDDADLREALEGLGPGTGSFLRLFHTWQHQRGRHDWVNGLPQHRDFQPPPPNFAVEYSSIRGCAPTRSSRASSRTNSPRLGSSTRSGGTGNGTPPRSAARGFPPSPGIARVRGQLDGGATPSESSEAPPLELGASAATVAAAATKSSELNHIAKDAPHLRCATSGPKGGDAGEPHVSQTPPLQPQPLPPPTPQTAPSPPGTPGSYGAIDPRLRSVLESVAVVKVNIKDSRDMGFRGPMCAIGVKQQQSFLDVAVRQIEALNVRHRVRVPMILVNSFRTHLWSRRLVNKYRFAQVPIRLICQSYYPLLKKDTLLPLPTRPPSASVSRGSPVVSMADGSSAVGTPAAADMADGTTASDEDDSWMWYPSGHGGVYGALAREGVLQELIDAGKTHIFISDIENVGATLDVNILWHMLKVMSPPCEFCLEVTPKTQATTDVHGGTLVLGSTKGTAGEASASRREVDSDDASDDHVGSDVDETGVDGSSRIRFHSDTSDRLELVEYKALSSEQQKLLTPRRFNTLNTNNVWISLARVQDLLRMRQDTSSHVSDVIALECIVNNVKALQLQTASAASAIRHFARPLVLNVPRSRFLRVKSTSDLLVLQSNLFILRDDGRLQMHKSRPFDNPPVVKLGAEFGTLSQYVSRVGRSPPDMLNCEHLTVAGDVVFGERVTLRGSVIIVAKNGARIAIPDDAVLENKVLTGSLQISDH